MISHPAIDFNPQAGIIVTAQDSYAANTGPLCVTFNGIYWIIQREDGETMPLGTALNVLAVGDGRTESLGMTPFTTHANGHIVGVGNTRNNATRIQNIDNRAKIFISRKRPSGVANAPEAAVRYDGSSWTIMNQDLSPLPHGEMFNWLVMDQSLAASEKLNAGNLSIGWLIIENKGAFAARFKLDFQLDDTPRTLNSATIQPDSSMVFRVPERATELQLTGDITNGLSVESLEPVQYETIPNATYQLTGKMGASDWIELE